MPVLVLPDRTDIPLRTNGQNARHTSPKRKRGNEFPRLRFGLV
jgi:hypothetical protein